MAEALNAAPGLQWWRDGHKAGYKVWIGDAPGSSIQGAKDLLLDLLEHAPTDANVRGPSDYGHYWAAFTFDTEIGAVDCFKRLHGYKFTNSRTGEERRLRCKWWRGG